MSEHDALAISHDEFARRRQRLLDRLDGAVGILFAGEHAEHLQASFRPHPHFTYFTGITDEPGAAVVFDPSNPIEARRTLLFLRPLNPEVEKWDGYRLEIGAALREKTGFKAIFRTANLPRFLGEAVRRARRVACLHPLAAYDAPVSPDLALFRKLAERVPGLTIEDRSDAPAELRAVKSPREIELIQRAIDITGKAIETTLRAVRPGMTEFDVQETLEHAYRTSGSRGPAFATIAGAGINSTVLHYKANAGPVEQGDLICLDSGAAYGGYGADITRTFPADGRFTPRQREIYDLVLKAQEAAIMAVKPGATLAEVDKVARAIITDAGYGDAYIHGIGHHLGLETHDATPLDQTLRPGNVLTIEPGVYLPHEKIGVRIEDDVVVTDDGCRNLAADIPKRADKIEAIMTV